MKPQPREEVLIIVQSVSDAYIGLMAVKESSTILEGNRIDEQTVKNEILKYFLGKQIDSIALASSSQSTFDETNSFIITNANSSENAFEECQQGRSGFNFPDHSDHEISDDFEDNVPRRQALDDQNDNLSDTWIFENFIITNSYGQKALRKQLPAKATSYIMTAFSIHPDKGLSLSQPLRINTASDYVVEIHMPSRVFEKDMIKFDLFIFNFRHVDLDLNFEIDVNETELQIQKKQFEGNSCSLVEAESETIREKIPKNSMKKFEFYVRAMKSGQASLNVKSSLNHNSNQILSSKSIEIMSKDDERGETKAKFFDLREHRFNAFYFSFAKPDQFVPGSIISNVLVAGNVIGPSMNIDYLKNSV